MARVIKEIFSKHYGHITATWQDDDTFTVVQVKDGNPKTWFYNSERRALMKVRQLYPVPVDEGSEHMERACAAMDRANDRFYESVY